MRYLLLFLCITCSAQVSYFNEGFLRQGNAQLDRQYLGINGTNATPTFVAVTPPLTATTNPGPLVTISYNENILSNVLYADIVASTNGFSNPTNNDMAVSNNLYLEIVSATNNALFLATNNDNSISNSLWAFASTNNAGFLKISNNLSDVSSQFNSRSNIGFDYLPNYNRKTATYSSANDILAISTWISRSSAADNGWQSICWSSELGIFVAVSNDGTDRVMTSPNGVNWTSRNVSPGGGSFSSVCWSPELGLFLAVSQANTVRVMTSPDGINWTDRTGGNFSSWTGCCWSKELGIFVIVGYSSGVANQVLYSSNGTTWSTASSASDKQWNSVCWSKEAGLFAAVANTGSGNRVMTSPDGINWSLRTDPVHNDWTSVCWSSELNLFVAVASNGTADMVMTSRDGLTWTNRTSPAGVWNSVSWSPDLGMFAAVASGGQIMTSPDGLSWTLRTAPVANNWRAVAWSKELNLFAAVSQTGSGNRVMTSRVIDYPLNLISAVSLNATNESLLIGLNGSNNVMVASNNLYLDIVSATNNALFLATNNDNLIGLHATNNDTVVSNGVFSQIQVSTNRLVATNDARALYFGGVLTMSNALLMDVTHTLSLSNLTPGSIVIVGSDNTLGSGAASGNVPVNANGTASTSSQINSLFPGYIVTNNNLNVFVQSNALKIDVAHTLSLSNLTASRTVLSSASDTLVSAAASGAVPIDADGSATTFAQIAALGAFLTNNESVATVFSNTVKLDAAHALSLSNLTASRIVLSAADDSLSSAAASGAVSVNADGSATTFAQINALGAFLTNNESVATVFSNTVALDLGHALSLSNLTTGHVLQVGANSTVSSVSSGAVPIDGDGTATTSGQLVTALSIFTNVGETNPVVAKSSNYTLVSTTDNIVLMNGNLTATLPTAVGIGGKVFTIKTVTSGTNGILTTSSQTIDGAAKWTNTANNKFTIVVSDNANWRVIGQN